VSEAFELRSPKLRIGGQEIELIELLPAPPPLPPLPIGMLARMMQLQRSGNPSSASRALEKLRNLMVEEGVPERIANRVIERILRGG